jgi:hypothetical protein
MAASDGSMAVWSFHKAGGAGASAEVHFNYWRISGDRTFKPADEHPCRDFVEIGIWLVKPETVGSVCIYLPGQHWDFEDVAVRFTSPDIVQGIFNTQLTGAQANLPSRVEVQRTSGERFCRIHQFPTDQNGIVATHLTSEKCADGTLLKITQHALDEVSFNLPENVPAYFRLRAYLHAQADSPFVKDIVPSDRNFQTGYEVVDYLDFRLNEARSLPTQVEEQMRVGLGTRLPITMVAFLTAVPVQSNVTTSSLETHKMRLLEQTWNDYVPGGIPRGMMVYHWKRQPKGDGNVEDFSAFVKMATRVSNRKILAVYLIIAFGFGVAGNLAASWIWDFFTSSPPKEQSSLSSSSKLPAKDMGPTPPANSNVNQLRPDTSTK